MRSRGWQVIERIRAGETLVFDGGYGTMLFAAGLLNGACPELWNDTHADVVAGIHQGYFDAGSDIVGISALMTTTMPGMKRTIDALAKAGLRDRVKVMIGGAPVSQAFADDIGADGYAKDSTLAVVKAKQLVGVAVAT